MARFTGRDSSHLLQQQQLQQHKQHRNQHKQLYSPPFINVPPIAPPPIPPMPRTNSNVIRKTLLQPGLTCDAACRKKTKQYRALLDDYLSCIGKDWDMSSLRMNFQTGICAFQYKRFVICIEVPVESVCFFLYTCVLVLDTTTSATATTTKTSAAATATTTAGYAVVMRRALELNYLTQTTRGCTLSMDPTTKDDEGEALELTLSYSQPILGLVKGELCTIIVNFLDTAQHLQQQLLQCCPKEVVEQRRQQQERSSSLISSTACSSSSWFVTSIDDGDCESSAYSTLTPTTRLQPSATLQQHKASPSSPMTSFRRKTLMNRPTSSPGIAESHAPRFLNLGTVSRKFCDKFVGSHVSARRADDSSPKILQEEDEDKVAPVAAPPSPPAVYRTRCTDDIEIPAGHIGFQRTTFTTTTKALHRTRKSAAESNSQAAVPAASTPQAHHFPNNKEESSRMCRRPEGSPLPRTEAPGAPGGPTRRFAYPPSILTLAKMEHSSIPTQKKHIIENDYPRLYPGMVTVGVAVN